MRMILPPRWIDLTQAHSARLALPLPVPRGPGRLSHRRGRTAILEVATQGDKGRGCQAVLKLRAAHVGLLPPKDRTDRSPLPMLAVAVRDPRPRRDREPHPLERLTPKGEADLAHTRRIVAWDEARWPLKEDCHVLKVGARSEARRLDDANDLHKSLAFDAVTTWRGMYLERRTARAGRGPDRPPAAALPASTR